MTVTIRHGDCREVLRTLPDESVHCVVTSPPYFGLRDYGVSGQIGLEATPSDFVEQMVAVFREVRRVLRDDGTLWLNLGDSYAGSGRGGGSEGSKQRTNAGSLIPPSNRGSTLSAGFHETARQNGVIGRAWVKPPIGLKQKDLIGIPWEVAFALRADGWYLRQDIIWSKPNPMPESVVDRCTKAHEYIFLLSKSAKYFYDAEAIKEQAISDRPDMAEKGLRTGTAYMNGNIDNSRKPRQSKKRGEFNGKTNALPGREAFRAITELRNKRSVWEVTTQPFSEAHFATFPPALIEPCIKAGCPEGGTVLDPFGGAGTTGLVADRLRRDDPDPRPQLPLARYAEPVRTRMGCRTDRYRSASVPLRQNDGRMARVAKLPRQGLRIHHCEREGCVMTDHCSAGLPVLPAGMTNELFYKEQAEYWRQIATQNHIPTPAQAASNQSSHSERISAADKDRECSIDGGRTQIVVLTREAIKRAIHPFCFSGKNADAIADSILALAPVAPAPVSLLEAIHRLEDMIPKLRIDHSHREAEILHNIIHHLSRLASFEDPKTPGMVSVGLLNTERSTGDRLRVENDQLRAALAAQPPAAPVEKRPPGAGPAGATFGGFEPLSPPQSCSAETGHDEDHTRSNSNAD